MESSSSAGCMHRSVCSSCLAYQTCWQAQLTRWCGKGTAQKLSAVLQMLSTGVLAMVEWGPAQKSCLAPVPAPAAHQHVVNTSQGAHQHSTSPAGHPHSCQHQPHSARLTGNTRAATPAPAELRTSSRPEQQHTSVSPAPAHTCNKMVLQFRSPRGHGHQIQSKNPLMQACVLQYCPVANSQPVLHAGVKTRATAALHHP